MKKIILTIFLVLSLFIYKPSFASENNTCWLNSYSNWNWTCTCEIWYEWVDKNDLSNLDCFDNYLSLMNKWFYELENNLSYDNAIYYFIEASKYGIDLDSLYGIIWKCYFLKDDFKNAKKYYYLSLWIKYDANTLYRLSLSHIRLLEWKDGIYYINEAKKTAESENNLKLLFEINDMYNWLNVSDINNANYLASQWFIVDQSNEPLKYNLGHNVLRQEIAAISLKLWEIDKKNKCDNLFSDLTSIIPNSWACLNIEPLLEKWLISNNKKFRPEENITKTEALWMLIKVKWLDYKLVTNSSKTWQQQIVEYAVREWLVEDFTDYDTYATRAWIFQVVDNIITNDILNSLKWLE